LPQAESAAEQVAVELVSRAVKTTGLPNSPPRWTELDNEDIPLIKVRLQLEYPNLFIDIWDRDSTPPNDPNLDHYLMKVDEISQQWGYYQPRGGGKVIWAALGTPHDATPESLMSDGGWHAHGLATSHPDHTPPRPWTATGRCWAGVHHPVVDATPHPTPRSVAWEPR